MTTTRDLPDSPKNAESPLNRILFWAGMAGMAQFLVFGLVGVARGYSVQTLAPVWFLLGGVVLLIPSGSNNKWASFPSSLCLIVFGPVSLAQGKHQKLGEELYEAGKYEEAMIEFRREIDTWYLRLKFNHHEASSLFKIAACQSQLEQFKEAQESYRTMTSQFHGFHQERAEKALLDLEANLEKLDLLKSRLTEAPDDQARAQLHFDLALTYREMTCHRKAIEHYERILKLDAPEPFKQSAKKFADKLR